MPCPRCDSLNIWYAEGRVGHYVALVAASNKRFCKDCGGKWKVRKRRSMFSQAMREATWAGMAGIIGFGIFFGVTGVQSYLDSKSKAGVDQTVIEKIVVKHIETVLPGDSPVHSLIRGDYPKDSRNGGAPSISKKTMEQYTSKKNSNNLAQTAQAFLGGNFDLSRLTPSEKKKLADKAKRYLQRNKK